MHTVRRCGWGFRLTSYIQSSSSLALQLSYRKGENGKKVLICIKLCTMYIECNCKAPRILRIAEVTAQPSHNFHHRKRISMTHLCKFLQTKLKNYSQVSTRNLAVQVLGSYPVTCSTDFPTTHFLPPPPPSLLYLPPQCKCPTLSCSSFYRTSSYLLSSVTKWRPCRTGAPT